MDLTNFDFTPEQFILEGRPYNFTVKWQCGTNISILCYVKQDKDDNYYLYIKGNYPNGGKLKISLSHPDRKFTLYEMLSIAKISIEESIWIMIKEDYPRSLKKNKTT